MQIQPENREQATRLLYLIWKSLDWEKWGSYRLKIYEMMGNWVNATSLETNSLPDFASSLCSKLQIELVGRNLEETKEYLNLVNNLYEPGIILDCYRFQIGLIMAMLKVKNQTEKEEREGRAYIK